ncbi:MAG: hypothetical protein LBP68_02115 [Acidobacteriota bacterium]|jgi:hypothetical protein|nr:hypothetical protein [Acidobacteriota bacterium]
MVRRAQLLVLFLALGGVTVFAQQQSSVQIKPYGYIKLDAAYDTSRTSYGDWTFWTNPSTSVGGGEESLSFGARETRLGLNITVPTDGRKFQLTGKIEGDFDEEASTENKYVPRLRLAYFDIAWGAGWSLRFGQDWDTYISFHPTQIDAGTLGQSGHLWNRHPQIRLTKETKFGENTSVTLKIAVQHGRNSANYDGSGDNQPDENAAARPNVQGGLVLKTKLLSDKQSVFSIAGAYGREKVNDNAAVAYPGVYRSWLVVGDVQLPLHNRFTVQGSLWTGENLDNYFGGIGQGVNVALGTEVKSYGAWGQIVYTPSKLFQLGLGYGLDDPDDTELSGDARTFNDRIFTNFFYNLTSSAQIGVEYSYMRTDYAVTRDMHNNRIHLGARYNF